MSSSLEAVISRWPSASARSWAAVEVPRLCSDRDTAALVVYGSSIRPVADSADFDLLYFYYGSGVELARPPIDVDVRRYAAVNVELMLTRGSELLGWSMKFGRLICEHHRFWTQLVSEWEPRLRLPSAHTAVERAGRSELLLRKLAEAGDLDAAAEQFLTMLTQLARARLIRAGQYPLSRPELPVQLEVIRETELARYLRAALEDRNARVHGHALRPDPEWLAYVRGHLSLHPIGGAS